jgi:hypothetical protein
MADSYSFSCFILTPIFHNTGSIKCNALGVEAGTIADAQITASSQFSAAWAAHKARLNKASNWLPIHTLETKENCWLQVDMTRSAVVTGVATQGRHDAHERWTKTYQLVFSDDGVTWTPYKEDGTVKVMMMVQASCCSRSANWYHSRENRLCYLKEHV